MRCKIVRRGIFEADTLEIRTDDGKLIVSAHTSTLLLLRLDLEAILLDWARFEVNGEDEIEVERDSSVIHVKLAGWTTKRRSKSAKVTLSYDTGRVRLEIGETVTVLKTLNREFGA